MIEIIKTGKVSQGSQSRRAQKILSKKLPDETRKELLKLFENQLNTVSKTPNLDGKFRNRHLY